MKKTKENAITLISLIITVIILMILAGIVVSALMGDNGLITRAKDTKNKTQEAQIKEKIEMVIQEIRIDEVSNSKTFNMQILIEKIPQKLNDITIEEDGEEAIGEYEGYNYRIKNNYEVIIEGKSNIKIKTEIIPKEYTKENATMQVEITSNESPIKEVQEPKGLTKNSEGKYVVTQNGKYKFVIETENGEKIEKVVTVNNIDKLPPKDFKPEIEKSGTTIKIKENAEDQEETEENACSGIDRYEYYVDGKKYESNEITNLTIGNTYSVYVIAFDKAGNSTKSSEESVKITVQYKKISAAPIGWSVLAIDFEDNLWQWGVGNQIDERGKPKKLADGTKFVDIIATDTNKSFAIDEEKNLWSWSGETPIKVLSGIKVKKVSAYNSIHVIDEEGNLWGWGENWYGQLGDGSKWDGTLQPENAKKIAEGIKFKDVEDAATNAYAIDEDGNLWAWGRNSAGLVGECSSDYQFLPHKISKDIKFEKIFGSCNSLTAYAIDNNQNLYGWGSGIGNGSSENVGIPTKIMNETKVVKVTVDNLKYALDVDGNLWGWGHNSYDQLEKGNTEYQKLPIRVMEQFKIKEIYGRDRGVIVDENNNIYFYGQNKVLQYNTGIKKIGQIPNLKQIVCISGTILAIDENGNRWGWGNNDYGELGNGIANKIVNQLTKID